MIKSAGPYKIAAMMTIFMYVLVLISYPFMPEQVGIHWSGDSERPDGFAPKWIGLFILPITCTAILPFIGGIFYAIGIFEDRARIFGKLFVLSFSLFMFYTNALMLLSNLNVQIPFNAMATTGLILFLVAITIGIVLFFVRRKAR